jgi:hypothetical protein
MASWAEDKRRRNHEANEKRKANPHCLWVFCTHTETWATSCGRELTDKETSFSWETCPHCHQPILTEGADR